MGDVQCGSYQDFEAGLNIDSTRNDCSLSCDILIIGAGPPGCLLARKLSKHFKVILLEQGENQNNNPIVEDPSNVFIADNLPSITLNFTTTRQPGLAINQVIVNQGQGIGGSTLHNYMVCFRTSLSYLQALQDLFGPAFTVESSHYYLKKIETYIPQPGSPISTSRGTKGLYINSQLVVGNSTVQTLDGVPKYTTVNDLTDPASVGYQMCQESNGFGATALIPPFDDYNSTSSPAGWRNIFGC
jgi:choline dehydrogenase-like flavoprotein